MKTHNCVLVKLPQQILPSTDKYSLAESAEYISWSSLSSQKETPLSGYIFDCIWLHNQKLLYIISTIFHINLKHNTVQDIK